MNDREAWKYTYTAFSFNFAVATLSLLGAKPNTTVYDPFVGSGTTSEASAILGANSIGVDISPFSCLLSRVRLLKRVNPHSVAELIETNTIISNNSELSDGLSGAYLLYAKSVIHRMVMRNSLDKTDLWHDIINRDSLAAEAIALLSLCLAARSTSPVLRGSNPIWFQKGSGDRQTDLRSSTRDWANKLINDVNENVRSIRGEHEILNVDSRDIRRGHAFDFCLSSPPYANRLDYAVAHRPELEILQLLSGADFEMLRSQMVGTTKITYKGSALMPEWGRLCSDVLNEIENHSSYASRRYYYHIHRSYFMSLYDAFRAMVNGLKLGGSGVIVVQNSYYKDIEVPTHRICTEMLRGMTGYAEIVRSEAVKSHMGRLSPRQNAHAPNKTLQESIIYFKKSDI